MKRGFSGVGMLALVLLSGCGGAGGTGNSSASLQQVAELTNCVAVGSNCPDGSVGSLQVNAGSAESIFVGRLVVLANNTTSYLNAPITYQWTLSSKPAGSAAVLSSSTARAPSFTPDLLGDYTFSLLAADSNTGDSGRATVTLTAIPLPSTGFTKLNERGNPLPVEATVWCSVRENARDLDWERKISYNTNDERFYGKTYTNYDDVTKPQKAGSNPGQADLNASSNSLGFRNWVNSKALCGAQNWRLPTAAELLSRRAGEVLGTNYLYFGDVYYLQTEGHWSSDGQSVGSVDQAWYVNLDGTSYSGVRDTPRMLRLVRNAP